ncbi:MAG: TrkH family potassium uptake protein, partial [Clostridia bacterium]|nr:TrkH family potassium uptake protein [Clostridia bacterium]
MNYRAVLNSLGRILQVVGGLMLLPLITALIYRESPYPFIITAALMVLCGTVLTATMRGESSIYAREGFLIVALSWLFMSLFGALPFVLSGVIPSFVSAFFETVSGFTTTGATTFTNLTGLPHGILFWRSFTHWIGGMGVLVFLTALLPKTNSRAVHIIRAETTGPVKGGKLVPRMRSTATILYALYLGLTVLEIIMLLFGGMSFFEAVTYSFATAGTGGFAISNAGLATFGSDYIYIVVSVFMLLFGVNFNLYYLIIMKNFKAFFKNEENRWYFTIVGVSTLLIAWNIFKLFGTVGKSLLMAFFNVSTIITTTGFTITDFNEWPSFSKYILVLLMLCGACAGSTGGAVKVSR